MSPLARFGRAEVTSAARVPAQVGALPAARSDPPTVLHPAALTLVAGGLMALGAQVRFFVPGTEVPMTLQPMAMLLIGMTMPIVPAACGLTLYVLCGAAGLPVFASPLGIAGPTGGYLLGFVPAVALGSAIAGGRGRSFARLVLAGWAAMLVLFLCGVAWKTLGAGNVLFALQTGFLPFAPKAFVEVLLAATAAGMLDGPRARCSDGIDSRGG